MRRAGVQPDRDVQVSAEVSYQVFKKDLSRKLQALLGEAQRSGLSRERFTVWVKGLLRDAYKQAFDLGLKAAGWTGKMEDADHLWLGSFQNTEERYLDGFISDLYENKGIMPKPQRLQMYADSLDSVFTAGKLAAQPSGTIVKWVMSEAEHCKDCIRLAMGSPYTKETLPTQPGVDVACLSNCKCHLEFEEPPVKPVGVPIAQTFVGQEDVAPRLGTDFPLRLTPPVELTLPHLEGVKLRIGELQMLPPEQLVKLQNEAQQRLVNAPFPSRAYNLQALALLGILLAFSRNDEQDDVALTQRYRDAGVLPLGDLRRPNELWTVQPVPNGWSARSSGSVLGVFADKGVAYEMLIAMAKKQGRTVPSSLQTSLQRSFGGFPLFVKSREVSAYDRTDPHTGQTVHVGEHMDRRDAAKEKQSEYVFHNIVQNRSVKFSDDVRDEIVEHGFNKDTVWVGNHPVGDGQKNFVGVRLHVPPHVNLEHYRVHGDAIEDHGVQVYEVPKEIVNSWKREAWYPHEHEIKD